MLDTIIAKIFESEVILGYIIAAIVAVYGWLKRRANIKDERLQKGLLFLEQGVEEVWEETVKNLKAAASDGKLTTTEKMEALKTAKKKAIAYAKDEGWNLFTSIAESTIPVIIRKIVDSRKPGKNV